MKYMLVIFLLMQGEWVRGDTLDGWASVPYPTLEACERSKMRAEAIQEGLKKQNARAYDKRFECEERVRSK